MGHGVSNCATCDGYLFKGKKSVVIGGGDSAMEDALVLARTSSEVVVIHRRDSFRASHILQQRVLSHPRISVKWNTAVIAFHGGKNQGNVVLEAVEIRNLESGAVEILSTDSAFVAVGHTPNTQKLAPWLELDASGYIKVNGTRSSIEGVFAAGDVADYIYRQAITSAGTGAAAALDAERWLSEQGLGMTD
jgi:thioredoxin reductase (NADPH)